MSHSLDSQRPLKYFGRNQEGEILLQLLGLIPDTRLSNSAGRISRLGSKQSRQCLSDKRMGCTERRWILTSKTAWLQDDRVLKVQRAGRVAADVIKPMTEAFDPKRYMGTWYQV